MKPVALTTLGGKCRRRTVGYVRDDVEDAAKLPDRLPKLGDVVVADVAFEDDRKRVDPIGHSRRSIGAREAAMPVSVRIDARSIARASTQVRRASPTAWKALRAELVLIGNEVRDDARSDASYSMRIPGTIRTRVTGGGNVKIVMGGDQAPNAVPIENAGKGFVRHPTFGHRDRFTSKNSRPAILVPAYARRSEVALKRMERAYLDTFVRVFEAG